MYFSEIQKFVDKLAGEPPARRPVPKGLVDLLVRIDNVLRDRDLGSLELRAKVNAAASAAMGEEDRS